MEILYVGAHPQTYQQKITTESWRFFNAINSKEALKVLNDNIKINFIICEYNLPGNTGFFLFNLLKETFNKRNINFIIISPEFKKEVYKRAFEIGIDDYFVSNEKNLTTIINRIKSIDRYKNAKFTIRVLIFQ